MYIKFAIIKMKPVKWLGRSYSRLKRFPEAAMREAGYELKQVQLGSEPSDWKSMSSIGFGVKEIRIHDPHEHRVVYIAKYAEAVYVLHAFEKKTQKTPDKELDIARKEYAKLQKTRQENYEN